MSDFHKAMMELWMQLGDMFHDLAHACYTNAGKRQALLDELVDDV